MGTLTRDTTNLLASHIGNAGPSNQKLEPDFKYCRPSRRLPTSANCDSAASASCNVTIASLLIGGMFGAGKKVDWPHSHTQQTRSICHLSRIAELLFQEIKDNTRSFDLPFLARRKHRFCGPSSENLVTQRGWQVLRAALRHGGGEEGGKASVDSRTCAGPRAVVCLGWRQLSWRVVCVSSCTCVHVHCLAVRKRNIWDFVVRVFVRRDETCRAKLSLQSIALISARPNLAARCRQPPGNNAAGFALPSALCLLSPSNAPK